jgi:hypothetical protein
VLGTFLRSPTGLRFALEPLSSPSQEISKCKIIERRAPNVQREVGVVEITQTRAGDGEFEKRIQLPSQLVSIINKLYRSLLLREPHTNEMQMGTPSHVFELFFIECELLSVIVNQLLGSCDTPFCKPSASKAPNL